MSSDLFGGGGSVDFNPITRSEVRSPGFELISNFGETAGIVDTRLRRTGSAAQSAFSSRFPRILGNIDTLREGIKPGFSDLRQARRQAIADSRSRGIGNLRENLRRRRVSGASFANDQIINAEAEFGKATAESDARSFLDELQANQEILTIESAQIFDALNRELAEANLATGFATNMANLFSANQMFATQLAIQEAQAEGSFFGNIAGLGLGLGGAALLSPSGTFAGTELGNFLGLGSTGASGALGGSSRLGAGAGTFEQLQRLR